MARASESAKPMNAMPWSWPRASGWRATPLMKAAKTMPTPIPGPMAERPYPTTFRLPVIVDVSFLRCPRDAAEGSGVECWSASVVVGDGGADVGRRQHDEDVGLHHLDEGLEEREDDGHP